MLNPEKKYNYDYYMDLVDKIVKMGAHILGIKDSKFTRHYLLVFPDAS
jgi:pyruvate carboxylase